MSEQYETNYEFSVLGHFGTERIYLKELKYELNYATIVSVKSWCRRHNVTIFGDGHNRFIFKYDLDKVYVSLQIRDLKLKYKENWQYAFDLAQRNELYKMDELIEPHSIHNIPRYKPQSKAAKKLMNI